MHAIRVTPTARSAAGSNERAKIVQASCREMRQQAEPQQAEYQKRKGCQAQHTSAAPVAICHGWIQATGSRNGCIVRLFSGLSFLMCCHGRSTFLEMSLPGDVPPRCF